MKALALPNGDYVSPEHLQGECLKNAIVGARFPLSHGFRHEQGGQAAPGRGGVVVCNTLRIRLQGAPVDPTLPRRMPALGEIVRDAAQHQHWITAGERKRLHAPHISSSRYGNTSGRPPASEIVLAETTGAPGHRNSVQCGDGRRHDRREPLTICSSVKTQYDSERAGDNQAEVQRTPGLSGGRRATGCTSWRVVM